MSERPGDEASRPRLSSRIPQMALEGLFVVFAVLVALAVDEWWEGREEDLLARTAQQNITAELRRNVEELRDGRADNRALLSSLNLTFEQVDRGEDPTIQGVQYEFALLGSDAWNTAQVTRAVHFMEFEQVARISRAYRIMALFSTRQEEVVDGVAGVMNGGDLLDSLRPLRSALNIALAIECDVVTSLERVITELETGVLLPPPDEDVPSAECEPGG